MEFANVDQEHLLLLLSLFTVILVEPIELFEQRSLLPAAGIIATNLNEFTLIKDIFDILSFQC